MTIVNIDGNTYDTDDLIRNRGYVTMFPAMVNDVASVGQKCQDALDDQLAALAGEQVTTSTDSRSIVSSGNLSFTTADNLDTDVILPNQCNVKIYSTASPANYMYGTVTNAVGTALTVTIYSSSGSGTFADWTIFREGRAGVTVLDIQGLTEGNAADSDQIAYNNTGVGNRRDTIGDAVRACTTRHHSAEMIHNNLATDTDYVVGYFAFTATLAEMRLQAESGTGTLTYFLSPDRTSASGTAITSGSGSVSSTLSTLSFSGNNTVSGGSPRYLIARTSSISGLRNVMQSLQYTKLAGA